MVEFGQWRYNRHAMKSGIYRKRGVSMSKEETLRARLNAKKEELKQRQESYLVLAEREINTSQYERNAISDLLVMMQLKAEIQELEFEAMLKE